MALYIQLSNGLRVSYAAQGSGAQAAIFIHGRACNKSVWDTTLERLPPSVKGFAYDLRGHGSSSRPDDGYTYESLVQDLELFMAAMEINDAILVGHSLGATFLQDFALKHPSRVRALVLSNAIARNVPPLGMSEHLQQRMDAYGTLEQNRRMMQISAPRFYHPANVKPDQISASVEINATTHTRALKELLRVVFTEPSIATSELRKLQIPTLIVSTTHDIVPFAYVAALKEAFVCSEVCIVEQARHLPMIEKPDRWRQHVFDFFEKVISGRGQKNNVISW